MDLGTILISLLIGLGVLVLFLIGFVILKTMLFSPPQKKAEPRSFVEIDGQSVAERLGLAVQYKTISYADPEKFDAKAFQGLHRLFQTLYPQVHAQLKREIINDFSLLFTWEGKNPELKPIMLTSHLDVVPAAEEDTESWTYPPFSGEVAEGFVWGRGTLDIKCGVVGALEAVEYLLKQGFQPERTVYLAFGHDEEVGGPNGAVAMAELLASRGVELGSLMDEGGSVISGFLPGVETPVGVVGISEKGYLSLKLVVEVNGGHSSMPARETAIGILSRAIARLEANPMPAHLEVVEFLMGYLGSALPFAQRMFFANTWLFGGVLKKRLAQSNLMNASIRTTTAPTIINAGVKDNVLPARAEAVVNFRIMPGDTLRTVYEMVLDIIDDERVKVTPLQGDTLDGKSGWDPSPVADTESAYFLRLSRLIKEAYPEALVAPYLVLGGTDARHYAPVTDNAFRFTPVLMDNEDIKSVHGVNERISVENCSRMVGFYIAYIQEIANLPGEIDEMNREGLVSEDEDEEDQAEEAAAVAMTPDSDETIPTPAVETKSDPQADAADDNM
jgi:carboxypeptidase PM20D1